MTAITRAVFKKCHKPDMKSMENIQSTPVVGTKSTGIALKTEMKNTNFKSTEFSPNFPFIFLLFLYVVTYKETATTGYLPHSPKAVPASQQ